MSTIVAFHAHPDDECIATGGTLRRAADAGHRVVLVFATRGEVGEVADGFLHQGETLDQRRTAETEASASILGASRVAFLGYRDSGMMGTSDNDDPACFWQADVEEAAVRLAAILRTEGADVLTVYDDHGGYGHPDHIQVHRVGHRAAELAGTEHVLESTMNRDHFRRLMADIAEADPDNDPSDVVMEDTFGSPESIISVTVDVTGTIEAKRSAMRAHASQIGEDSFFLAMPDEAFRTAFGSEWFIRTRGDGPADWILPTRET